MLPIVNSISTLLEMKKGFLNGSPFGSVEKAKTGAEKVDKEAAEKAAWPWPRDDPNEWSGSGLTKAEKDEMRAERRRVREFVMKVPLQVWSQIPIDMMRRKWKLSEQLVTLCNLPFL